MNKYLLGVLIGLGTIGTTYASIVSRGFLDEALTSYATTTALDLKANQSDLTNLSNIVGTPTEMTYYDMVASLGRQGDYLFGDTYWQQYADTPIPTNDISEFIRRSYTDTDFPGVAGLFSVLFGPRNPNDSYYPIRLNDIFNDYGALYNANGEYGFFSFILNGGSVRVGGDVVYGLTELTPMVDANTAKIGTIDSENTIAGHDNLADALRAINAKVDNKIENLSETASAGKYVLTAVKVGDQTTYAWELIDRSESEATTTTITE